MSNFKSKTINGLIWSMIEQFASQGIAFTLGIIIARQIMPSDYGLIAMLGIFMAIAQTFVDSGFSNALIQKQNRSRLDYSTVFYFNIIISTFFFLSLFFCSPFIAEFYNEPRLISITRIVGINIILSAFIVVPRAKLSIDLDFKSQTKASVIAVSLSGMIGIIMAYKDYGVWTLVTQSLLNNAINGIILWYYSKWFPILEFSIKSFKRLFIFGSKILFSGLLDTIYKNIYLIVIGKKFSSTELGYYSRANQLAEFPSSNLSRIIGRVAFPVMCEVQQDNNRLKSVFIKFIKLSTFIIFPIMIGLAVLAEPFIVFVLTDKWIGIVPLLQILCISCLFYPIHGLNLTILQAKGRSDLFFKLEIIKKAVGIIVLLSTIPFGIEWMCIGLIITSILCLPINMYYTKKILDIGFFQQFGLFMPSLTLSSFTGGLIYLITLIDLPSWLTCLLSIIISIIFYYYIAKLFRFDEIKEVDDVLLKYIPYLKKNDSRTNIDTSL